MLIWLNKTISEKIGDDWKVIETVSEEVTREFYNNAISFYNPTERLPFLKLFMGKETAYTDKQGRIVKLVSTNPDDTIQSVWNFKFYRK